MNSGVVVVVMVVILDLVTVVVSEVVVVTVVEEKVNVLMLVDGVEVVTAAESRMIWLFRDRDRQVYFYCLG